MIRLAFFTFSFTIINRKLRSLFRQKYFAFRLREQYILVISKHFKSLGPIFLSTRSHLINDRVVRSLSEEDLNHLVVPAAGGHVKAGLALLIGQLEEGR